MSGESPSQGASSQCVEIITDRWPAGALSVSDAAETEMNILFPSPQWPAIVVHELMMRECLVGHLAVGDAQEDDNGATLHGGVAAQIRLQSLFRSRRAEPGRQAGRDGADNLTCHDRASPRGQPVSSLMAVGPLDRAADTQHSAQGPVVGDEPLPEPAHPACAIGSGRHPES